MIQSKGFFRRSLVTFFLLPIVLHSQVQLRDTIISWQHHMFELNDDYSVNTYSTNDNDIQQVQFSGKVIENELIRLVVVPEYGARIISFVYKPTNHEYLYQSECGSPYGMNDGNFYYDWLMVYGGIFPTFPEPEHGKTWLLPWNFNVEENTGDSVIISMEYTDTTMFDNTPGQFNNGITNITCRIEVGVYMGSSLWDFNVSLKNNTENDVNYEYWTCTTLTPGSNIGNTGSPLNSEMVVPIENYEAAWSPGNWIGNYGSLYDFTNINYLSEWDDMGIAYANNLVDNYWGVINHDNEEGIFRISENIETPGMKFWTWGKYNVDNDLYDFSNGGKDNYIELWAGVSDAFFTDAILSSLEEISWNEAYCPTVNLAGITKINNQLAVNIGWNQDNKSLYYELLAFNPNLDYRVNMYLTGENNYPVIDNTIYASALGNTDEFIMDYIGNGNYTIGFEVYDQNDELILFAEKDISITTTGTDDLLAANGNHNSMTIISKGNRKVNISMDVVENYKLQIFNISGQLVLNSNFTGASLNAFLPSNGIYIVNVVGEKSSYSDKIIIN